MVGRVAYQKGYDAFTTGESNPYNGLTKNSRKNQTAWQAVYNVAYEDWKVAYWWKHYGGDTILTFKENS